MLGEIQPDSYGYINLDQSRQATYYILIEILKNLNVDLIIFQEILLSLSIVTLFFFISKQTSNLFSLLFYSLIVLNIYYTSFAKVILTESILFSLFNFAIVLLFELEKKTKLILFGLICGLLASLKPIGLPLALILIIFSVLKNKKFINLVFISIFFIIPIISENIFFHSKFDKRKTIFKQIVVGKIFVLSGKDSFKINEYPENLHSVLSASKEKFIPVNNYLETVDNILLKSELLADYEVVAQYQILNVEKKIILDNPLSVFLEIIKNNFLDYLILSAHHYIGNWSIGSKFRLLNIENSELPMYSELIKSSGPINYPNYKLLYVSQLFFVLLFLILSIYTLIFLLSFLNLVKLKIPPIDAKLIFIIQAYLLIISFTNVTTPRYLMLIYPLTLLISIKFVYCYISKIFKVYK